MKFSLFDIVHWPWGERPSEYDAAQAAKLYASHLDDK